MLRPSSATSGRDRRSRIGGNFDASNCLKENLVQGCGTISASCNARSRRAHKICARVANYILSHRHALQPCCAPKSSAAASSRAPVPGCLPFGHDQPVHFRADLNLKQCCLSHAPSRSLHPPEHLHNTACSEARLLDSAALPSACPIRGRCSEEEYRLVHVSKQPLLEVEIRAEVNGWSCRRAAQLGTGGAVAGRARRLCAQHGCKACRCARM